MGTSFCFYNYTKNSLLSFHKYAFDRVVLHAKMLKTRKWIR